MPDKTINANTEQRVMRVFISSTFRDMREERDELVKQIFPQVRKLCEDREVTWSEVDLRWGITDEQSSEGKVLPICLSEIHRCRPYFICLLGERYGWVPFEISQNLIDREPWLSEHLGRSVTELEILHGVLNNPAMAGHALFYFRDPSYINKLPTKAKYDYVEIPTREEIKRFGIEAAKQRAKNRRQKLRNLKTKIRISGLPLRENYPSPKALGQWILQDLTKIIDKIYPKSDQPSPLELQNIEHKAFAHSRSAIYIVKQKYLDRLNNHAVYNTPPLVVTGDSGSGKSALLANWALQFKKKHPKKLLILHHIGSASNSADWAAMLRRIMEELKLNFEIKEEIPRQDGELRSVFGSWLHKAATRGRFILIIDSLNALEDKDQALDLVWLPPEIPINVRLILSSLPGRPLDKIKKRSWPTVKIDPLNDHERRELIRLYLAKYAKTLSEDNVNIIVSASQSANPLYLRMLLEELRVFGEHFTLREKIDEYLQAVTIEGLFQKILARYEQDYEQNRKGLVCETMKMIWASRKGLSEAEIMDLLGSKDTPLPHAHWSPFFISAEHLFVNRSGLIGFFHDYIRKAVFKKYIVNEQIQKDVHLRLADYFESRKINNRTLDELPWQLSETKMWRRLYNILINPSFLSAAWKNNEYDVKTFWSKIEANSSLQMVDGYRPVVQTPSRYTEYMWEIGTLLTDMGHTKEALPLRKHLVEHFRSKNDKSSLAACIGNLAELLKVQGDFNTALALQNEAITLWLEQGNEHGLIYMLVNQANILYRQGKLEKAMSLFKEAEGISRKLNDMHVLQGCLGGQSLILQAQTNFNGALTLLKEQERICRQQGNKSDLEKCLGNQAVILTTQGDLHAAMELLNQEEQICREIGSKTGLAACFANQANILCAQNKLDDAMQLYKRQESLCRKIGDDDGLQASYGNQAIILRAKGDILGALGLHKKKEKICRKLNLKDSLQICLGNQANILMNQGDLDGAMKLQKEKELICQELGNLKSLQTCLLNQGALLSAGGAPVSQILDLYKKVERICRDAGIPDGLAMSLAKQAALLADSLNNPRAALPLIKEACQIADKHGLAALGDQIRPVLDTILRMTR
jgi:tetratricopeptide (TPR) repeat protein